MTITRATAATPKTVQAGPSRLPLKPEAACALAPTEVKSTVPAVEQAARILLCLADSTEFRMRLTDICDRLEIPKSKGHAILNTLTSFELVDKDPKTKTYSLGPALIFLSQRVLDNLSYPEVSAPFLENLVRETRGTAAFGLVSGAHVFVIAKRDGIQNIGFRLPLGHKFHITLGAHGKAIVAFMDEAERGKLLAKKKLYFYGDSARMDFARLKVDIAQCRRIGFAQDIGEVTPGVSVLSAPVFAIRERIVGCLILIGTFEPGKVQEYGSRIAQSAKQISRKLGAHVETIFTM